MDSGCSNKAQTSPVRSSSEVQSILEMSIFQPGKRSPCPKGKTQHHKQNPEGLTHMRVPFFLETGFHFVAQASFELAIFCLSLLGL
jgi:hypothetical protein